MSAEEERAKSGWAREAAVRLARRLYGRRIEDSLRVIGALLEEKESFLTFGELLQKTGLSEWRLKRAIGFLISTEVVVRRRRSLYSLAVEHSFLSSADLELFLAARAAFRLAGSENERERQR